MKYASRTALDVVKMTNTCVSIDENFVKKFISVILVISWIKLQYTQRIMHMIFYCVFRHLVSFDYTHILQGYFNGNETLTPVTEKDP